MISKTPRTSWSGPFRGIKLLKSDDNGSTWHRVDRLGGLRKIGPSDDARNEVIPEEMFFLEEHGMPHQEQEAYPFSFVDFVQHGRDNSAASDDWLYIYSPEGAHSNKLLLARVDKEKLGVRAQWQYFVRHDEDGQPVWSPDITQCGCVHKFPEKSADGNYFGWYSWLPSVVWNPGLQLYIMVNGGTYAGHGMTDSDRDYYDRWMHTRTGSLGFWYSENPYGPWQRFHYTDYWTNDRRHRHALAYSLAGESGSAGSGIVNQKVEPRPSPNESTQTRPPWTSTMRFTRVSPIPVPGHLGSSRRKSSNTRS